MEEEFEKFFIRMYVKHLRVDILVEERNNILVKFLSNIKTHRNASALGDSLKRMRL
jgi:hypothetical protein